MFPSQFVEVIDINRWAGGFLVGLSSTGVAVLFGYLSPTIPGKKTGRWIDSILILVHPNGWKREGKSSPQPNLVGFLSYFSGSSGLFCISTNYTNCVLIYYDRDPRFFLGWLFSKNSHVCKNPNFGSLSFPF